MSFSSETKNELARLEQNKKCCMLAEIAGFLRVAGRMKLVGLGKKDILVTTENPAVARLYKKMIKTYFDSEVTLEVSQNSVLRKNRIYTLEISHNEKSEEILRETGMLMIKEGMNFITDGILSEIVKSKCCKKSYLRGLFLGSGNVADPEKNYHFEIVCHSEALARDVIKLINSFDNLNAKCMSRNKSKVVYLKNSEMIIDILNIMNAHSQLLKIVDIRIVKDMRNQANRINNCDSANLDKALKASEKQLQYIEQIEKHLGIDNIPEKLREVAYMRKENPEATLQELAEMMDPPMKKSGLNNRMKKIQNLAENIVKELG